MAFATFGHGCGQGPVCVFSCAGSLTVLLQYFIAAVTDEELEISLAGQSFGIKLARL